MPSACLHRAVVTAVIAAMFSTAVASFVHAQAPPTPAAVEVGPWRTGVPVHCPDGRTIPANTVISGPNVTADELCGTGTSSTTSSSGAVISNTGNTAQDLLTNSVNLLIVNNTRNPIVSSFMQGAATGFISSLFADNGDAQRQQQIAQQMAQEILRRNQELELQRRIAEQQRFDAMIARLNSELKLEGVPFSLSLKGMSSYSPGSLQLKGMSSSGPGDLKLKISDATPTAYGLKGLPGIYVGGPAGGDATGDGSGSAEAAASNPNLVNGPGTGTTGPGIPGLPGIYLDPAQPSQAPQLAQAAENLNGPERSVAQDVALQAAEKNPTLSAPSQDPQVQNFQQANQDYQQAAAANAAASQDYQTAQAHVEADQAALDVARSQLSAITPSVEQQQAFNQMLAAAKTDEEASMLARQNFDSTQVHLSMTRDRASTALAALTPPSPVAAKDSSVVDLTQATRTAPNLLRAPSPAPVTAPVRVPPPPTIASAAPKAPAPKPALPQLCAQLSGAQTALRRLMETQNMHNENRKEWEETINDASDDAWERGFDMIRDYTGEALSKHLEGLIKQSDDEIEKLYRDISNEKNPYKVGEMQKKWEEMDRHKAYLEDALHRAKVDQKHLDELTAEREYLKWAPKYDGDLEGTMDGIRQVSDILLGDEGIQKFLRLSPEGAAYIKYAQSIGDSGYDILREVLGAQQIKQLNQNAEQYLQAVNALKGSIRHTVAQINEYKARTPEGGVCPASPPESPARPAASALR